ncbi:MAG TPA: GAF domain-containing sensor histidine kinase [Candidatus Solibacter sp.]|nr:GAF domain-containing sensor histidine kinase [Candidatus Solibacter sp.]
MTETAGRTPSAQTREQRQAALLRAGVEISSELSLPVVLQRIVDLAAELTGARYGALGVLGVGGGITEFITRGVTNKEREAIGHIPVGLGILGLLIEEPHPIRLRDLHDHAQSVGFPANHPPMRSFLGAPVLARGRVFGNIYLTEKQGDDEFTPEDEESLVILATQAGVAIENSRLYEESRQRQRWLESLQEITEAILEGESDPDALLRLIAERARQLVDADLTTVAVPAGGETDLVIRVAQGAHAEELLGMTVPIKGSISGDVIKTGRPVSVTDASADPRSFQPMVGTGHMGPATFAPITRRGAPYGTMAVARLQGSPALTEAEIALVETFAAQVSLAMEYSRLQRELSRLAVMDERERIATELHDGVIQGLFAMGMNLQATAQMVSEPVAQQRIDDVVSQLDGSIRDLRNYIFALRPGALADRQLQQALRDVAREFQHSSGVATDVDIDEAVAAELAGRAADVVQLAREALSNVRRHAQASRCSIKLSRKAGTAILEIKDNGVGFDARTAPGKDHQGLRNLRRRVSAMGGKLKVVSTKGAGTTVRAVMSI